MSEHVQAVQAIYEAFGRGDIDAILERLAPDIAWESWEDNHATRGEVAYLVPKHDREGVRAFFGEVAKIGIRDFQVLDFLASERQVVAEVHIETPLFTDEELHLWTFGEDGLVHRFRHYVDTAKHLAAAREAVASGA